MAKNRLIKTSLLIITTMLLVGCGSREVQESIKEEVNLETETNVSDDVNIENKSVESEKLSDVIDDKVAKTLENNIKASEEEAKQLEEEWEAYKNKVEERAANLDNIENTETTVINEQISDNIEKSKDFNEINVAETVEEETKAYTFPFDNTRDLSQPFLNTEPNKLVILDVDMNTDVDDVCAVRMATTLDDLGVIDLKAVCYCTDHSSQGALRGILHHDGKDDVLMGQGNEDRYEESPYWNELGKHNDWGGNFERSVRQYRKVLASATSPVDIITTGQVTNIEELLKSGPDDISPLTGMELVKTKVGQLYVVGGDYPEGWSNNFALTSTAVQATKYMINNWPLPIIYSPGQVGGKLVCGRYLQDLDTQRLDPVTRSLWAFGTPCGRAAWDPFGVWLCGYACGPENQVDLIRISTGINDGGGGWMTENPNGKDFMVALSGTDLNYYNQTMDNHLIYMFTKIYGIENPNKEPIGLR